MKKVSVLAVKILAFALTLVYVFAFLAMGFMVIPVLADLLKTKWNLVGWGVPFVYVFWGVTTIGIALLMAVRGFRFVGKWERESNGVEELDLSSKKEIK